MNIAEKILRFRALNNLTQQQAGELFGVTAGMIYQYEKGAKKPSKRNSIRFNYIMENYSKE